MENKIKIWDKYIVELVVLSTKHGEKEGKVVKSQK